MLLKSFTLFSGLTQNLTLLKILLLLIFDNVNPSLVQNLIKYYSNVFIDIIHRLNYLGDLELEADLIHDYTAALQLDDPGWFSHNHIEDTDWQEQGTLLHKGTF